MHVQHDGGHVIMRAGTNTSPRLRDSGNKHAAATEDVSGAYAK